MTFARDTRLGSMDEFSRSIRSMNRFGNSIDTIAYFEQEWRCGHTPTLEQAWIQGGRSLHLLSALIKVEIIARFERGERPSVREYLDRFPELKTADEQVISLVYEEFCLLEEGGQAPSVDHFCDQYRTWADSLASQLRYHRLLSQVAMVPSGPRTPSPSYPQPGQFFAGQFLVRRVLGVGGAGRVYLADQPEFERQVALKVSPDLGREHAIQGRLDHDHVMPVWSVFIDESTGLRGICMPFRPGCPLDAAIRQLYESRRRPTLASNLMDVVERQGQEPGPRDGWRDFPRESSLCSGAAWIGLIIARALAHAHGRGVVHRDVKPANIFLAIREGPQLLDFNLAHAPSNAEQAESARSGGTLPYMAPEQLEAFLDPVNWDHVGPAADIYALGLVMVEMLTGQRPDGPNPEIPLPRAIRELLDRRLLPPVSPRSRNPEIPHTLASIVLRCLAPNPADRYSSAETLADDLERFLDDRPVSSAVGVPRSERTLRWFRRHRVAISTLSLVLALTIPLAMTLDAWRKPPAVMDPSVYVTSGNARLDLGFRQRNSKRLQEAAQTFQLAKKDFEQALQIEPDLYTGYAGLAFIQCEVFHNYERSIELQKLALSLATKSGSTVKAEVQADLLKNLAVAITYRARQLGNDETGSPGDQKAVDLGKRAVKELGKARSLENPLKPFKPDLSFRITAEDALVKCFLGDLFLARGSKDEAGRWFHSALIQAESALQKAQLLEKTERERQSANFRNLIPRLRDRIRALGFSLASD